MAVAQSFAQKLFVVVPCSYTLFAVITLVHPLCTMSLNLTYFETIFSYSTF